MIAATKTIAEIGKFLLLVIEGPRLAEAARAALRCFFLLSILRCRLWGTEFDPPSDELLRNGRVLIPRKIEGFKLRKERASDLREKISDFRSQMSDKL